MTFKNQRLLIVICALTLKNVLCESGSWESWWKYEGISGKSHLFQSEF